MPRLISYTEPPTILNLATYVENRTIRQNAGFSRNMYLHNGEWFEKEIFEKMFPVKLEYLTENPDGTSIPK